MLQVALPQAHSPGQLLTHARCRGSFQISAENPAARQLLARRRVHEAFAQGSTGPLREFSPSLESPARHPLECPLIAERICRRVPSVQLALPLPTHSIAARQYQTVAFLADPQAPSVACSLPKDSALVCHLMPDASPTPVHGLGKRTHAFRTSLSPRLRHRACEDPSFRNRIEPLGSAPELSGSRCESLA